MLVNEQREQLHASRTATPANLPGEDRRVVGSIRLGIRRTRGM
jgi:hypothetical protein